MSNRSLHAAVIAGGALAIIVFTFAPSAFAQSTGAIQGTVTDPSGGAVPTAIVTVKDPAHGVDRTTATDSTGDLQRAFAAGWNV